MNLFFFFKILDISNLKVVVNLLQFWKKSNYALIIDVFYYVFNKQNQPSITTHETNER